MRRRGLVLILALAAPLVAMAQQTEDRDPWDAIRFFQGVWEGSAEGRFGRSTVHRSYEFVLDGAYLHERNTSEYPPQESNPEGETHDDWSFFSYDRARATLVLRQFHDEQIVNVFTRSAALSSDGRLVFESERIENFTAGWSAREVYTLLPPDEFVEQFYLAPPGGEFELFITSRLKRTGSASASLAEPSLDHR